MSIESIVGKLAIVQQTMETIDIRGSENMNKFLGCIQYIARLKTELMSEEETKKLEQKQE